MNRRTSTIICLALWSTLIILACADALNIKPGTAVIGTVEIHYLAWTCQGKLVEFHAVQLNNAGEPHGRFIDSWLSPIPCSDLDLYTK